MSSEAGRTLREIRDKPASLDAILQRVILQKLEEVAVRISESREVMNAQEAADFLRIPYGTFRQLAPELPRHAITEARFVYLRSELLGWLTNERRR